jgi:uncharacterized membrane protein YqjE
MNALAKELFGVLFERLDIVSALVVVLLLMGGFLRLSIPMSTTIFLLSFAGLVLVSPKVSRSLHTTRARATQFLVELGAASLVACAVAVVSPEVV